MRILQIDLDRDYSGVIQETVKVLSYGGVVVYPTDTLYGMGANALNDIAVRKVYKIKERSFSKPLPIIVRNMMWALELAYISERNKQSLEKIWPGKVTAILPKKEIISDQVSADTNTVGIRVPNYIFIDQLLAQFGYPIISTSANISGEEGTTDINKVIATFQSSVSKPDLIIDAGILPKASPSTVVDLTSDKPKILRVGPSSPAQFMKLLEL